MRIIVILMIMSSTVPPKKAGPLKQSLEFSSRVPVACGFGLEMPGSQVDDRRPVGRRAASVLNQRPHGVTEERCVFFV